MFWLWNLHHSHIHFTWELTSIPGQTFGARTIHCGGDFSMWLWLAVYCTVMSLHIVQWSFMILLCATNISSIIFITFRECSRFEQVYLLVCNSVSLHVRRSCDKGTYLNFLKVRRRNKKKIPISKLWHYTNVIVQNKENTTVEQNGQYTIC